MALAPRMEVRQQQSLVMTPQLQQAIKLLQMSSSDLASYLTSEAEKNPLLEVREATAVLPSVIPDGAIVAASTGDMLWRVAADTTLWSQLQDQIRMMRLDDETLDAALILADELEEDGYLRVPLEEVCRRHRMSHRAAVLALEVVQSCDPTGVGARDLVECLALQLRERDRLDPAMATLLAHLDLAARGELRKLQSLCGVDADDVVEMIDELRSLDPKPGLRFGNLSVRFPMPDVMVSKKPTGFTVELNTMTLPHVLVDNTYIAALGSETTEAQAFISECRSAANWLVRSLEQRARTILKVASEIVLQQEAFFSEGILALRPLTQRIVADRVGLHESTVGRVASGKILSCDRGSFELKFFFSPAIQSVSGGSAFSALSVRNRIRALVEKESAAGSLSDDELVASLRLEGIEIARRTVAKYRGALGIPSSVVRRRRKSSYLSKI
jgi:RNA polymerase sigma-54 factor